MNPIPNSTQCAYYRRKENRLGDSLEDDFESPIYFMGRRDSVTKSVSGIGGIYMSNTQTYCDTNSLPLSSDEMKKDDVIVFIGSNGSILDGTRMWRVQSVDFLIEKLPIRFPNDEMNEMKCPKRIAIQ